MSDRVARCDDVGVLLALRSVLNRKGRLAWRTTHFNASMYVILALLPSFGKRGVGFAPHSSVLPGLWRNLLRIYAKSVELCLGFTVVADGLFV